MRGRLAVWGPDLSPFVLGVWAMLDAAGITHDRLPEHGSRLRKLRVSWHIERAKRRGTASRWDGTSDLDEYPLVPFLLEDDRHVSYDSSAIARRLAVLNPCRLLGQHLRPHIAHNRLNINLRLVGLLLSLFHN
jgi:glutathione S-transferase